MSNDEEIIARDKDQSFFLSPPTSVEPPKEKPPPPPVDVSDDENHPPEPLKRLNSTRRLKKELRTRRSDFLGIEGVSKRKIKIHCLCFILTISKNKRNRSKCAYYNLTFTII